MDGDDYSSSFVQDYLAAANSEQQSQTENGSTATIESTTYAQVVDDPVLTAAQIVTYGTGMAAIEESGPLVVMV